MHTKLTDKMYRQSTRNALVAEWLLCTKSCAQFNTFIKQPCVVLPAPSAVVPHCATEMNEGTAW